MADGRSKKRPLEVKTTAREECDCPICLEPWAATGDHRVVCLKCGHLFGNCCIERWVKEQKKCATCNAAASVKDIRFLFISTKVTIADTRDVDEVTKRLHEEKRLRAAERSETCRLKVTIEQLKLQLQQLQKHQQLQGRNGASTSTSSASSSASSSSSAAASSGAASSSGGAITMPGTHSSGRQVGSYARAQAPAPQPQQAPPPQYAHQAQHKPPAGQQVWTERFNLQTTTGSRCVAFALQTSGPKVLASLACGASGSSHGFQQPVQHGLLKVSLADTRHRKRVPLHSQALRDMQVSRADENLLLTTSFDRTLRVTDMRSDNCVCDWHLPSEGWSCAWSSVNGQALYCGLKGGAVACYDLRKTSQREPLATLALPNCRQPVHSLAPLQLPGGGVNPLLSTPATGTSSATEVLLCGTNGGVWACEVLGQRYQSLPPLHGNCISVNVDSTGTLCLASSRGAQPAPAPLVAPLGQQTQGTQNSALSDQSASGTMNGTPGLHQSGVHALFLPRTAAAAAGAGAGALGAFGSMAYSQLRGHKSHRVMSRPCIWSDHRASGTAAAATTAGGTGLAPTFPPGTFVASGDEQSCHVCVWDCSSGSIVARLGTTSSTTNGTARGGHPTPVLSVGHAVDPSSHSDVLAHVSDSVLALHRREVPSGL